jgi:hypothetical protein
VKYEPRHPDYNPEKHCPAKEVQVIGNSEFDLICELPTKHDAEYHVFQLAPNVRITWKAS